MSGRKKPIVQMLGDIVVREFDSLKQAVEVMGYKNGSGISLCCKGIYNQSHGYNWFFKSVLNRIKIRKAVRKAACPHVQTSVDKEHWHNYKVNKRGFGETTKTYPLDRKKHRHSIEGWKVVKKNDHKHRV